jgi:hypothetical protein
LDAAGLPAALYSRFIMVFALTPLVSAQLQLFTARAALIRALGRKGA